MVWLLFRLSKLENLKADVGYRNEIKTERICLVVPLWQSTFSAGGANCARKTAISVRVGYKSHTSFPSMCNTLRTIQLYVRSFEIIL